ncbi:MAG: type III pantothenate kinase [Christensenellales bacterium]
MYLVFDVGNSNIKFGLYEGRRLINSWRIMAANDRTSDEFGIQMNAFFSHIGYRAADVEGVIISSVKPSLNYTMEHMCEIYLGKKPLFVSHLLDTGLRILYDNPEQLGTDRIVNAVAAREIYGGPSITVDFGTATTFGALSAGGEFIGGTICPGVTISTNALVQSAAKLPTVELVKPSHALCTNTIEAMQAGIIYGYVGQVDYIITRIEEEMGGSKPVVVATGGMARLISAESKKIDTVNSLLTLEGLSILYLRNHTAN